MAGLLLLGAALLRMPGLGRSFWLDEAWVANSVLEPGWGLMFFYPGWLQTTPPLFLVLARGVTGVFGPSHEVFRALPFLAGVAGTVLVWLVARRMFREGGALLVLALAAFSPAAVELAQTFKQYTFEALAAALVLWLAHRYEGRRTGGRFVALLVALPVGCLAGYSMAFLAPGMVLLVARREKGRAAGLAVLTLLVLGGAYVFFAQPNQSEALRRHWLVDYGAQSMAKTALDLAMAMGSLVARPPDLMRAGRLPLLLLPVLAGLSLWLVSRRDRAYLWCACALPILLHLLAQRMNWYPASFRTSLFLLPGLAVLLSAGVYRLSLRASWGRAGLTLAALAVAGYGIVQRPAASYGVPAEDMEGAVNFVYEGFRQGDRIYVHTSAREAFRFYAKVKGWEPEGVRDGATNWTCCVRGMEWEDRLSSADKVERDLVRLLEDKPTGRVWVLMTARRSQWTYTGFDDTPAVQEYFRRRGCEAEPAPEFYNVRAGLYRCGD